MAIRRNTDAREHLIGTVIENLSRAPAEAGDLSKRLSARDAPVIVENQMFAVGCPVGIVGALDLVFDGNFGLGACDLTGVLINTEDVELVASRYRGASVAAVSDPTAIWRPSWPSCLRTAFRDLTNRCSAICSLQ